MIEVQDLEKRYGSVYAVRGVSFTVEHGTVVGLLGPNGAGKTSIMKVLTGFHYPSGGSISIDGQTIYDNMEAIKAKIGYLPEHAPVYPDLMVNEYLSFVAKTRLPHSEVDSAIDRAIQACNLEAVFYKNIDTLSKGFQQRVALAQAIIHNPSVLILDEPTTGLDPNQILDIRELISNLSAEKTIILSTHIMQEAEALCESVIIVNEGIIAGMGKTHEITASAQNTLSYSVVVKKILSIENVLDSARMISNVQSVDIVQETDNTQILQFHFPIVEKNAKEQYAESIFRWAVKEDMVLLSLGADDASLEDVFAQLKGDA